MRFISETSALAQLTRLRNEFAEQIRNGFEHRAMDCSECPTQGACCLDAHFVNVRITRLEAVAIRSALTDLPRDLQARIESRIDKVISDHRLSDGGGERFACPLFEKGVGCLVHATAKPLPCIAHACYENEDDLPPDELLIERELAVDTLNLRTYGQNRMRLPLPVAIVKVLGFAGAVKAPPGPSVELQKPSSVSASG